MTVQPVCDSNRYGVATVDPIRGVSDALKRMGVEGQVALVGTDFFPVKYARQLEQDTPGIEWMPQDELISSVRQIKSPLEIELFRKAGETVLM